MPQPRNTPTAPDDLLVIEKTRDLIRDLVPRLHKFPKTFRHTLGERAEQLVLDVLTDLIEARYSRERLAILRRANVRLETLRHLLRLANEFGLIANHAFLHVAGRINEVGRLVGAWGKKARTREEAAPDSAGVGAPARRAAS